MKKITIDFECYDYRDVLYSGTMVALGSLVDNTVTTDRGDMEDDSVDIEEFSLIGVLDDDGKEVTDLELLQTLSEDVYFHYEQDMINELLDEFFDWDYRDCKYSDS